MIRSIKGVKDLLPEDMPRWQAIETAARRQSSLFGYEEIRCPIFEVTELFARSIGGTTDIVEKEMYTFQDRDGASLTLRPEGTAGVVRAYIERNLAQSPRSQKLYYLGPMFRHERPQAGRLRQFHQYGVEHFGTESPFADVEVIALLWRFLTDLRLPDLAVEINSLGSTEDRPGFKKRLLEFLQARADRLCGNCRRRMATNPLRVLDCKVPGCREATEGAPQLLDSLSEPSREHFDAVAAGLSAVGVPYTINHRLVRGLDYYTMTAFEVTSGRLGAQNAVGAGGRYDGLVKALGGPNLPGVGFAVGLERVALLLPDSLLSPSLPVVYVAGFGAHGQPAGLRVLDQIRRAGIRGEMDYRATTLKAHLRQADRVGATWAVLIGDDEVDKGRVVLRNMETKKQEDVPLDDTASVLQSRLIRAS
ncbi:MAG: histidine--tRNA ligase [Nitrospirales bacterium]